MIQKIKLEAISTNSDFLTQYINDYLEQEGAPADDIKKIDIIIDELFSNIVKFAYKNSGALEKIVEVEFNLEPVSKEFKLTFYDYGLKFDPTQKEDPDVALGAEEREIGGLGIYLVKNISDSIQYKRENGKNILIIKKVLGGI